MVVIAKRDIEDIFIRGTPYRAETAFDIEKDEWVFRVKSKRKYMLLNEELFKRYFRVFVQ